MPRSHTILTGPDQRWFFAPDALDEGRRQGWHMPAAAELPWREVRLPAALSDLIPGATWYEGPAWFRHTFAAPEHWRDCHVVLRCEGINYHADAFLNGQHVAASQDGFLRISAPLDHALLPGAENLLVVRVDTTRRRGEVPGLERGWRPYGGILRAVVLDVMPRTHIQTLHARGDMHGTWEATLTIANRAGTDATVTATVEVARAGEAASCGASEELCVAAHTERTIRLTGAVPQVARWAPGTPTLYTLQARLLGAPAPKLVDLVEEQIGFRSIEASADGLLLNGQPVFLTGLNRHEDSPATGMCPDLAQVRADLTDMLAMGANFVRLCHYPHDPAELELCDELGLLVMGEIPLYWWRGHQETPDGVANHAKTLEAAKRQLARMIARDYNHPSIIFWSVSNENLEQHAEVAAGNRELLACARAQDPHRLVVHVSDHWIQHPNFDADDVVCVNWYPSYWGGGRCIDPNYAWSASTERWKDALATLRARYPHKPILVTEFGFPGLAGIAHNTLGEQTQATVIDAEFAGIVAHPYVCGATLWCYADHPWPEENFLSYLNTSPFGVVTRSRHHKPAYWHLRQLFRGRHGLADAPPSPPRLSDDMPVTMTRPHLADLPDAPFADGYQIRPLRRGEGPLWTDVQRDAEERIPIADDLFDRQFGMDEPAQTWRCFFIVDPKGSAVGTLSAWYGTDPWGHPAGRVHWVAVRHAHRRRGLARAGLAYVLRKMQQWHDRAVLDTSTARLGAIKLYLDFGFLPHLDPPGAAEAWASVARVLDHPALHALKQP